MLNSIQKDRKVVYTDQVTCQVDFNDLSDSEKDKLENLLYDNIFELNEDFDLFTLGLNPNPHQYGIIKSGGKYYFFNNEGYDYPKYIVEVINWKEHTHECTCGLRNSFSE